MSDCCSGSSCSTAAPESCPACGEKGQAVEKLTIEHMLKTDVAGKLAGDYAFCKTATCDVVYFANTGETFRKQDLRVRVGIKETEDPSPVCYCFDYTRERIFEEINATGESTALPFITDKVKAAACRCETENPSGRCCLGEVKKTIKAGLEARRYETVKQ